MEEFVDEIYHGYALNFGLIDECVNYGNLIDIYGNINIRSHIGGICGHDASSCLITNCYNLGNITKIDSQNTIRYSSGIVCQVYENGIIQNCFTIGENSTGVLASAKAAFVSNSSSAITNCYYNTETCGVSDDVATGLTTAEMKAASFVTLLGDSFEADVNNINNGYPVLKWQNQ